MFYKVEDRILTMIPPSFHASNMFPNVSKKPQPDARTPNGSQVRGGGHDAGAQDAQVGAFDAGEEATELEG